MTCTPSFLHEEQLSRRRLLTIMASGATAMGLAWKLDYLRLSPLFNRRDISSAALSATFSATQLSVLLSLMETLIGNTESGDISEAESSAAGYFNNRVRPQLPAKAVEDIQLMLTIIEYSPLILDGEASRFSRLNPQQRRSLLEDLMRGELSLKKRLFQGIKTLAIASYYSQPSTWTQISYDGPLKTRAGYSPIRPLGISTISNPVPATEAPGPPNILRNALPLDVRIAPGETG